MKKPQSSATLTDLGYSQMPRGWYDAQGSGFSIDYGRYVGDGNAANPTRWAVALAGKTDQYDGSYSEPDNSLLMPNCWGIQSSATLVPCEDIKQDIVGYLATARIHSDFSAYTTATAARVGNITFCPLRNRKNPTNDVILKVVDGKVYGFYLQSGRYFEETSVNGRGQIVFTGQSNKTIVVDINEPVQFKYTGQLGAAYNWKKMAPQFMTLTPNYIDHPIVGHSTLAASVNTVFLATIDLAKMKARVEILDAKNTVLQAEAAAANKAASDAHATLVRCKSYDKTVTDRVNKISQFLAGLNTAAAIATVAVTAASAELVAASAALGVAIGSNWIPFWNWGPSEAVTAACVVEEGKATAEVAATGVALSAALAAVAAEVEIQSIAESTKSVADDELAQASKDAIQADSTAAQKGAAAAAADKALQEGSIALKAAEDAYRYALMNGFTIEDLTSLLETLAETDADWQAMQGLDEIMRQYPHDGKYNPYDDDEPEDPPAPPEQCSDNGGQGFFDSLVFGEEYVIMTVLSGIADTDIFRGDSEDPDEPDEPISHIWTMHALSRRKFEFFTELRIICDAFNLRTPRSLNEDYMNHSEYGLHSENAQASLALGIGGKPTLKHEAGFKFVVKCLFLGDRTGVYNADGTAGDKRNSTGWLAWYRKALSFKNLLTTAGGGRCGCRIRTPGQHTRRLAPNRIVGGHMDINGISKKSWVILPICKSHNGKSYDRFPKGGRPSRGPMRCKSLAVGIQIKRK